MRTKTYVVMEAVSPRSNREVIWAWGTVSAGGPGFEEVAYTENDGYTPVFTEEEGEPEPIRLRAFLFCVTVEVEDDDG